MKIVAVCLIALALVIGIVAYETDCWTQDRVLTMANGDLYPMRCHWSALAERTLAIVLGALALMMMRTRYEETKRKMAMVAIVIGALVAAVPTLIIGVCASTDMMCNYIMMPTMIASGLLIIGICAVSIFNVIMTGDPPEMA
jgi:hypothetical protein